MVIINQLGIFVILRGTGTESIETADKSYSE